MLLDCIERFIYWLNNQWESSDRSVCFRRCSCQPELKHCIVALFIFKTYCSKYPRDSSNADIKTWCHVVHEPQNRCLLNLLQDTLFIIIIPLCHYTTRLVCTLLLYRPMLIVCVCVCSPNSSRLSTKQFDRGASIGSQREQGLCHCCNSL